MPPRPPAAALGAHPASVPAARPASPPQLIHPAQVPAARPAVPPPMLGASANAPKGVAPPPPPPGALGIASPPPRVAPPAVAPVMPPRPARPPPPPPEAAPAAPRSAPTINLTPDQLIDLELRTSQLDAIDYYELLKISQQAGPAEIKKAFYRESRAYHPDRFFHLPSKELKERVSELYKRVTEAYYVLRDDTKRRQYTQDITGPERGSKLRFTEASEAETKHAAKKEQEEQIGVHPKGRQFFQTGMTDHAAQRWAAAERNFKMALTYEPSNAKYKERLLEVQKILNDEAKARGDAFKIK